jgi:hypothetical protein
MASESSDTSSEATYSDDIFDDSTDDSDVSSVTESDSTEDDASSSGSDDGMEEMEQLEDDDDDEEEDPWSDFAETVFAHYQQNMRYAVENLVERDDMSREEAEREVYEGYLPRMNKRLRGLLVTFMCHTREMRRDPTYKKIVQTAQRLRVEDDMDYEESVTQAAAEMRKVLITRTLRQWTPVLSDDEDTEETGENEE